MANVLQPITYKILAYLFENPDAQDVLEGIAQWWVPGRSDEPNVALVREALRALVDTGLILARDGKDARTFYKVNSQRMDEISTLLAHFKNSDAAKD